MNRETLHPNSSYTDEEQKDLKQLVEMFGSVISLQEMASAYDKAGKDLQSTADHLCSIKGSTSDASYTSVENTSNASLRTQSKIHNFRNGQTAKRKPIKCPASLGTVSNVIGKEYIAPRPRSVVPCEKSKPIIQSSDEVTAHNIWDEEKELVPNSTNESLDGDLEDFIYQMLGNGFGLERNVIHDVIGQCGYNMPMSIDRLLDLSSVTVEKNEDVPILSSGNNLENESDLKSSRLGGSQPAVTARSNTSDVINKDDLILAQTEKRKIDIQREVLVSLFTVPGPEQTEEKPRLKGPPVADKNSPCIVRNPLKETLIEDFSFITRQSINKKDDDANELSYEELRMSAKEYWSVMKEYYKAAVDSFGKKDYVKARNLMENGHLYMRKAREADEKSAEKLVDDSDDENEVLSLNIYEFEPRDAMRTFRVHLKSFSGLRTIHYLKAVIGTDGGGKKDKRRKKLITELLEKEGIPWTEEGDGLIISVRVDVIDPTKLSFAKK